MMKALKIVTVLITLIVGVFSTLKSEKLNLTSSVKLQNVNMIEMLSNKKFECRPSSQIGFYVETELITISRGFNTVNAKVFAFDRFTGKFNLLANQDVIIPLDKDIVIHDDSINNSSEKTVLKNGDKFFETTRQTPYSFGELIKYEIIYNSYIRSTNKLLVPHNFL